MPAEEPRPARLDATATYLAAAIPRQFVILGQRMLPFSLWHMELLLRLGNGFVTPDETITEADLLQGVFFCCQSWEEGSAALANGDELRASLEAWGEAVGEEYARAHPKRFLKHGVDLGDKALLFAEYLREGSGRPELLPADGVDSRVPGAPLLQLLKIFLIRDLRLSMSQALNYPFALACHDFFAFHEQRGAARIANVEESETIAEHDAAAASDALLKACLEALPGAVPVTDVDRAKVRSWKKPARKSKRKGRR